MALLNLILAALLSALGLFEVDKGKPAGDAEGGAGDGDGDGDAGEGDGDGEGDEGGEGTADGTDLSGLAPAELQKALTKARRDAKAAKGQGKKATEERDAAKAQLRAIAKALGLEQDDNDPEKLQAALNSKDQELRSEKISNAVFRQAITQGASPEGMYRWLRGGDELTGLDPTSATFNEDVRELVKETLEAHEELKAKGGTSRQGGEFNGQQNRTLEQRIEEARTKGDHREVIRLEAEKLHAGR